MRIKACVRNFSPLLMTHAVARSEEDPSVLTGDPIQPSLPTTPNGDTWTLSSLPCPPGLFQAFLSQYCFRKFCVKGGLWYLTPSINVNPSFPSTPMAWYIYLKAEQPKWMDFVLVSLEREISQALFSCAEGRPILKAYPNPTSSLFSNTHDVCDSFNIS